MNKLTIIFGRNHLPFSWLIRVFTWSSWSHCGVVVADGKYVIEATATKGVVMTPINDFIKRYNDHQFATIHCDNTNTAYDRLANQIGKKYDFSAVFGILFRTGWNQSSKWFCSELVAYAANTYRRDRTGRITPEDIWSNSQ